MFCVSKVFRCRKDGVDFAIKIINESKMAAKMEEYLANTLKLDCRFLVRYFDAFREGRGQTLPARRLEGPH